MSSVHLDLLMKLSKVKMLASNMDFNANNLNYHIVTKNVTY
jgi:hypothetical protein